jgi:hypothetical protein
LRNGEADGSGLPANLKHLPADFKKIPAKLANLPAKHISGNKHKKSQKSLTLLAFPFPKTV